MWRPCIHLEHSILSDSASENPSVQALAWALARPILHGRLRDGDRLPTVRQLVAQHGIASQTVQKALSILKEQGLLESGVGRGSFVTGGAACQQRVGLVYPWHPESSHRWSMFYDATIRAAADLQQSSAWRLPVYLGLAELNINLSHMSKLSTALETLELGGLIFGEVPLWETPLVAPDFPLPRVGIMKDNRKYPHIPALYFDLQSFFSRAFERICEARRRRVGVVLAGNYSRDTIAIVNKHVVANGLETTPWLIQCVPQDQPAWAANAVLGMLSRSRRERPDALIVLDDHLVAAALEGCHQAGAVCGDDLTVIGYSNAPDSHASQAGVDFLGPDSKELISTALSLIEQQHLGHPVADLTLLPARFDTEVAEARSALRSRLQSVSS